MSSPANYLGVIPLRYFYEEKILKRAIYNAAEMNWLQALDDIAGKTSVVDHHSDAVEGVASFKEKRTPEFNKWLS